MWSYTWGETWVYSSWNERSHGTLRGNSLELPKGLGAYGLAVGKDCLRSAKFGKHGSVERNGNERLHESDKAYLIRMFFNFFYVSID